MRLQHLVETTFSVRMHPEPPRFERAWLEARLDLLRRFCLPSVAAQTADHTWLLFCDIATDPDVLAALRAHERAVPSLHVALTDAGRPPISVVRELADPVADVLMTTRLDSDDALADTQLEAVQEYAASFHRSGLRDMLVNFPRGYRLDLETGRVYEALMPNSPFHSLLERPRLGPPATVMQPLGSDPFSLLHGNHAALNLHHMTHQDVSSPGWLQVIHGGNLRNAIMPSDRERDAASALAHFTLGPHALGSPAG